MSQSMERSLLFISATSAAGVISGTVKDGKLQPANDRKERQSHKYVGPWQQAEQQLTHQAPVMKRQIVHPWKLKRKRTMEGPGLGPLRKYQLC